MQDEIEKIQRDSIEIHEGMQKRINILENDVQRCQKQSLDFELQIQHEKERRQCESSLKTVCETSWISKMEKLKIENVPLELKIQPLIKECENVKLEYQTLFDSIKKTRTQTQRELRKSVNTKFDKTNVSDQLLCVTNKQVFQKKTVAPKTEEKHVLLKTITLQTSLNKKKDVETNKNVIAPGLYKVKILKKHETTKAKSVLPSIGLKAASSVRRPLNRDSPFKYSVLSNTKKSSEKVEVSVRTNKKTYVASKNVVLDKNIVTNVDVENALKAKDVLCVSCAKNVLIPCHDKCLAKYRLNEHSNVRRALLTTPRTSKSMLNDTTPVVSKTRFSIKTTQSKSLDTTPVVSKTKIATIVDSGCTKHMTGDRSLLKNFVEKSMGTVCFGNDHFAAIAGYSDYVQGNITVCHIYYLEGLGHNLFSVGQFCNGARESNLYTTSISDMAASSLVCLLSKATSTKSWLWHRRLSYLMLGIKVFTFSTAKSKSLELNTAKDLRQPEEDYDCMKIKTCEEIFQDYALWDVIENGNSFKPTARTTANADGTSTSMIPSHVTTEEKAQNKNDVKARSMLLMALPNEHQLIFNQYKDAKTFFDAIQTRFGGNDATRKTQKTLLKQMYENFNAPNIESLDSIINRLQKIVSQLTIFGENISQEDLNIKILRISTANSPVSTTDTPDSTANLSDATIYAFLANQPNGSQLVHEDLEQIHEDDLEEMDLKWQLALLSMRARRGLRNQDNRNRNQDSSRRTVNVEETSFKAMVTIDGAGFDWSFMADEEVPTNIALMAISDSEFNLATYKRGLASVKEQLVFYKKNEVMFCDQIVVLKRDTSFKDLEINALKSLFAPLTIDLSNFSLEEFQQPVFEGYGPKASKSVCKDTSNEVKKTLDAPLGKKLVSEKEKQTVFPTKIESVKQQEKPARKPVKYAKMYRSQKPRGNQRNWNNLKSQQLGGDFVMYNKACFVCGSFDHVQAHCNYHQREGMVNGNNYTRVNYNYSAKKAHPNSHRNMTPRAVLMKTGLKPLNTARPVNTAHPKTTVYRARPMSCFSKLAQSTVKRPYQSRTTLTNKNFNQKVNTAKEKVYTAKPKAVNTARPTSAVVNAVRANQGHSQKEDQGYVDSGCSRHMTGNMSYLSDFKEFDGGYVTFGGGARGGRITGKGTLKTGKLDFEDVYFVKELQFNLFSVSQMCDKKNSVLFTDIACFVLSPDFKLPNEKSLTCLVTKATLDESMLWHRRLSHINFKSINKLVKDNLVRGLPAKCFENDQTCVAFLKGKQYKASCKSKIHNSVTQPLFMLHIDLFGPTFVSNLMNKKYCLVVTDDYSRFIWVFFLASKDETSDILKNFITEIENIVDKKVKIIRCDNETEFKNRVMNEFCEKKGIKRELSVAKTPQQNGVTERRNRTLIKAARTMLADFKLPTTFWAEAVNTACYVQNRVIIVKPYNKTPYELFRGRTPTLSFMRPFGCHVTILNTLDHLGKFDGKSDDGFIIGYSLTSKAFRVYNIRTKKVEENLHIRFLENKPIITGDGPKWLFDIDSLTKSMNYVPVVGGTNSNDFAGSEESNGAGHTSKETEFSQDYIVMPLWKDGSMFDSSSKNSSNDEPQPSSNAEKKDDEGVSKASGFSDQEQPESSTLNINTVSPTVITTRSNHSQNVSDMFSLGRSATLEATHADLFSDETEIDMSNLTTSYQVPTTPNTRIHKDHSLNLVIGDTQSGVQTMGMIKNTNEHGFISAVYEGKTHENLHTCLFACFISQEEPNRIAKALKLGNKKNERGIVTRKKVRLVTQGYTQEEGIDYDEVFALVARTEAIRLFLAYASFMSFMVYQMDVKSAFLYGTIKEEVYVCQPLGFKDPDYPDKVYKVVKALYGLHQALRAWTASTPIDTKKPLLKDSDGDDVDVHLYRSMIGSLMYLTSSRPDIMFAVCACARFQVTPKVSHSHAVKRIFRYLKGQPKLGLWYPRNSPFDLVAYSDSDYAGASLDRKSTTGGCQFLGCRLISWQCKKQTVVATSSTEAEYARHIEYLDTKIPQSSGPPEKVDDEVVHKELGDRIERAATTASRLEVEQDSGSGPRCQDTILGGVDAQTRTVLHTASASTLENGDMEITATIYEKVKVVFEASIRRHLKLEYSDSINTLPTTDIFEQLALMGSKKTAWEQFSSNIATAIICLATNRTFNFSKLIFDGMGQISQGKGSTIPVKSHHTPISAPSTSQLPNSPPYMQTTHVAEEAANMPYDLPLPRGHTPGSNEGSMTLNELTGRKIAQIDKDEGITLVQMCAQTQGRQEYDLELDFEFIAPEENYTAEPDISTANVPVSIAGPEVSTASPEVRTVAESLVYIIRSAAKRKDKVKAIMKKAKPVQKKTKLQLEQKRLGLEEALRLQEQLDEEERQRIARVQEEASTFNTEEWDNIQAQIEADEELALRLQAQEREGYSKADKARLLIELTNERKRKFSQQRAEQRRNKPMTQAQRRTYMCNYIKHMGSHTLQQLKKLSFDEIKELFEITMKRVNTFTPMESDDIVSKVVVGSSKRDAEQELNQESSKRQKIGE
ncbi:putative ribonuclease H-like domain-containing protein [Tanacetum coccineum]